MPTISLPKILQSTCIYCDQKTLVSCSVTVYWSMASLRFFFGVSSDPQTIPSDWEEVTGLVSGTTKTHTFTGTGQALFYRIVKDNTTLISTQVNTSRQKLYPGIAIKSFVTT